MIEVYVENHTPVAKIARLMKRLRQTIHKVVQFLKKGGTATEYVKQYKLNKKRCGRHRTQLATSEKQSIQEHLEKGWSFDVIKGSYPDNISCSMRSLYRLADNRGIFLKNDLPWKGKRKANGKKEMRGKQAFRRSLTERSEQYPNYRNEFGHLEGDTIVGKNNQSAVITLVEHQSKAIIALQTDGRKARDIETFLSTWLDSFPTHSFKSITFDCGKEFSNWKSLSN